LEQKFAPLETAQAVRELLVEKAEEAGLELNAVTLGSLKETLPGAEFFPLVVIELERLENGLEATQRYEQRLRMRLHYVVRKEGTQNAATQAWEGARKVADILASDERLGGKVYASRVYELRFNDEAPYSAEGQAQRLVGASTGYECRRKVAC
jgi:hypothetical protein